MGVKKHFTGSIIIGDDEGEEMEFESHIEMQTALVMLARRDVVFLENQIPFKWINQEGTETKHTFDYRVSLRDGSRVALIVKNVKKAAEADWREEMRLLASQVTPAFADRVTIITGRSFDLTELHNAELIQSVRVPDPEADAAARRAIADIAGAVTVNDIVKHTDYAGRGFRAVVRLIRLHELELVRHERISHDALVRRRHN
jgi:hypothetical protein